MKQILKMLSVFGNLFKKLGICATIGFIAGIIAGGFLLLLFLAFGGADPQLGVGQLLQIALLLTAFDWAAMSFLLIGLCRYDYRSVLLPALVNCLLTCVLTTLLVGIYGWWLWSIIVGMSVGLLVGYLLCLLSCRLRRR